MLACYRTRTVGSAKRPNATTRSFPPYRARPQPFRASTPRSTSRGLYNFPTWLDGRGQTIGILEFGGGIGRTDLASYFGTLNLPVPDVTAVSIDSGREQPDPMVDGEVMSNIEIAGAIAPKARIRVYFAADSEDGWEDAINRAGDDHVSIFFIGWGGPESRWTDKHINEVNMALRQLAQRGVTILVAADDNGVTDGVDDKHRLSIFRHQALVNACLVSRPLIPAAAQPKPDSRSKSAHMCWAQAALFYHLEYDLERDPLSY